MQSHSHSKPIVYVIQHDYGPDHLDWESDRYWNEIVTLDQQQSSVEIKYITFEYNELSQIDGLLAQKALLESIKLTDTSAYNAVVDILEDHKAGWCDCCSGEED
jgi:hypothetical protein